MEDLVKRIEVALDAAKSDPHGGKVQLPVGDVEAVLLDLRGIDRPAVYDGMAAR